LYGIAAGKHGANWRWSCNGKMVVEQRHGLPSQIMLQKVKYKNKSKIRLIKIIIIKEK
jgi:hypothetical protein